MLYNGISAGAIQVVRNLVGYIARHAILIGIDANRPGAWFSGSLGQYNAWFLSIELPADFEPGFESKPLEKGTCGRQADFEAKNTKVVLVHWNRRIT